MNTVAFFFLQFKHLPINPNGLSSFELFLAKCGDKLIDWGHYLWNNIGIVFGIIFIVFTILLMIWGVGESLRPWITIYRYVKQQRYILKLKRISSSRSEFLARKNNFIEDLNKTAIEIAPKFEKEFFEFVNDNPYELKQAHEKYIMDFHVGYVTKKKIRKAVWTIIKHLLLIFAFLIFCVYAKHHV